MSNSEPGYREKSYHQTSKQFPEQIQLGTFLGRRMIEGRALRSRAPTSGVSPLPLLIVAPAVRIPAPSAPRFNSDAHRSGKTLPDLQPVFIKQQCPRAKQLDAIACGRGT